MFHFLVLEESMNIYKYISPTPELSPFWMWLALKNVEIISTFRPVRMHHFSHFMLHGLKMKGLFFHSVFFQSGKTFYLSIYLSEEKLIFHSWYYCLFNDWGYHKGHLWNVFLPDSCFVFFVFPCENTTFKLSGSVICIVFSIKHFKVKWERGNWKEEMAVQSVIKISEAVLSYHDSVLYFYRNLFIVFWSATEVLWRPWP